LPPPRFPGVSIHAPLRGATPGLHPRCLDAKEFQSTHPCGVRQYPQVFCLIASKVSIHAPLRGATIRANVVSKLTERFNPRTPAGCDGGHVGLVHSMFEFQSTHPCGVRPSFRYSFSSVMRFQSTHPCGVRRDCRKDCRRGNPFQSTHPCGVRPLRCTPSGILATVSIHAPLRGATSSGAS